MKMCHWPQSNITHKSGKLNENQHKTTIEMFKHLPAIILQNARAFTYHTSSQSIGMLYWRVSGGNGGGGGLTRTSSGRIRFDPEGRLTSEGYSFEKNRAGDGPSWGQSVSSFEIGLCWADPHRPWSLFESRGLSSIEYEYGSLIHDV